MRPIYKFKFFKLGDYTDVGRGKFTEKEAGEISKNFFNSRAKGESVPIVLSLDPRNPHNLDKSIKVGKITDIFLETGGIMAGNGDYRDELKDVMEKIDGKSAGFRNTDSGKALDHIAITTNDMAVIKDLSPNKESIFAEDSKELEFYEFTEPQKGEDKKSKKGESKKMDKTEITFSEAEVKLKIGDAIAEKEKALKIEFAEEKKNLDATIEAQKDTIKDLTEKVDEFSKKENERMVGGVRARLEACKGLKADEKAEKLEKLINFSKDGVSWETIDEMLKVYEAYPALVDESDEFSHGDRQKGEGGDGKGEYSIEIPSRSEAAEISDAIAAVKKKRRGG